MGAPVCLPGGKSCQKKLIKFLFATTLVIAQAITVETAQDGEHRQYEAHEHGVAHLNVAVEVRDLTIEPPVDQTIHVRLEGIEAIHIDWKEAPRSRAIPSQLKTPSKWICRQS